MHFPLMLTKQKQPYESSSYINNTDILILVSKYIPYKTK